MKMSFVVLAVVLIGANSPSDDRKVKANEAEQEKLRGAWFMVGYESDGEVLDGHPGKTPDFIFDDGKLYLFGNLLGRYEIDGTKKPKHMDFILQKGFDRGTAHGIYKLEGDELIICQPEIGGARPKNFTAKKGSKQRLYVCKRKG